MLLQKFRSLAIAAAMLAAVTASAAAASPASFLVVHGIPGRDVGAGIDPQLPVDVLVNGSLCLLKNFTFGQIAGPFDVPAGTYSIAISLANPISPCSNSAVISASVDLTAGAFGAVVAQLSTTGAPTAGVYPIDVSPVPAGQQRFVVAHAADAPTVLVHGVSISKTPQSFSFSLSEGANAEKLVTAQAKYQVSIAAGKTVFEPLDVTGGNQGLFFVVAVGNAGSGSVTLLGKTIPSVF